MKFKVNEAENIDVDTIEFTRRQLMLHHSRKLRQDVIDMYVSDSVFPVDVDFKDFIAIEPVTRVYAHTDDGRYIPAFLRKETKDGNT